MSITGTYTEQKECFGEHCQLVFQLLCCSTTTHLRPNCCHIVAQTPPATRIR